MLTISLGTPSGKARMAAVPIVVPAEPAEREHAGDLSLLRADRAMSCAAPARRQ